MRVPTLNSEWESFLDQCLDGLEGEEPDMIERAKVLFYSGAFAMLTVALELNNCGLNIVARNKALEKLYLEHNAFHEDLLATLRKGE